MTNWKVDLDALVEETMTFAKSLGAGPPKPRTVVEPNRMPPVNRTMTEREEIGRRVANFKAHQERFAGTRGLRSIPTEKDAGYLPKQATLVDSK
jgi:hypothetical protein